MTETVTVSIPLDGSVPPCPRCGSITVDMDGKPAPCTVHDFCPECGGTKEGFDGPQFCPQHGCRSWYDRNTHCRLKSGHEGPHEAWARHPRFHWETPIVHILRHGFAVCGVFSRALPQRWPEGHQWSPAVHGSDDTEPANCPGCIEVWRQKFGAILLTRKE